MRGLHRVVVLKMHTRVLARVEAVPDRDGLYHRVLVSTQVIPESGDLPATLPAQSWHADPALLWCNQEGWCGEYAQMPSGYLRLTNNRLVAKEESL